MRPSAGGAKHAIRVAQRNAVENSAAEAAANDTTPSGSKGRNGATGRNRGRTAIFFGKADNTAAPLDYVEDEYGEEDHESVNQRLEFRERHQMPVGYDYKGARACPPAELLPAPAALDRAQKTLALLRGWLTH